MLAVKTISRPTISLLFGCLLASAQVPTPADKYAGSDPEALRQLKERAGADFDIRQREQAAVYGADREAKARDWELILGRRAALDAYRAATDRTGLRVTVNSFGLPKSLSRLREPLSAPSSDDSVEVAKGFLRTHEDLFRLSEEDLAGLRLVSKDASSSGLVFLHFTQSVGGIDVYQGHAKVTLNKAGQVIQAGVGDIIPRLQLTAKPELSAQDAVQTAFRLLGLDPPSDLEQLPSRQARHTLFRNPAGDQYNPIRVELSILPLTVSSVRLAYRLFLGVGAANSYEMLIDAEDGRLLLRRSLLHSMGQARVWKRSPIAGARELVDFPDGWLPSAGTVTTGNNVDAYLDSDRDDVPDSQVLPNIENGRASSAAQVFDFPAAEGSTGANPRNFKAAAVTNLFYLVNESHDYYYDLGFTEPTGNFQTENFGRGGEENDAVRAESQDGTNGASFLSAPDGIPGIMQMGIFTRGTGGENDDRDSSFAAQVVIHEYGHGVSTRIVGGPDDATCLRGTQSRGLGEGWSDYFSNSYTNDPVQGAYPTGNAERGVRRQSYEGYTFTYEDLGNDGFDAPQDEGEIWAATLWDQRNEFGRETTDPLVMDGLKLTPCNPTMIDARDAILTAQQATKGIDMRRTLWEVFARHGLGHSASGIDGTPLEGTVYNAAFDLPPDLQPGNGNPMITSQPPLAPGVSDAYVYDIEATDPDGDTLNYELTEGPDGMTVDPASGLVQWPATFTQQRVKVAVTDGNGGRVVHGFRIRTRTRLTPGQAVTIAAPADSAGVAEFDVPIGTPVVQVTLRGGNGDPDFLLLGPDGVLRLSVETDTPQTFSVSAPRTGPWEIVVIGQTTYADVSLEASCPVPTLIGANTEMKDLSGEATSETFYRVMIPPGTASFSVSTQDGSGDVDLYVSRNRVPVCSGFGALLFGFCVFDEFSVELGNADSIEIDNPEPGDWFIDLFAFDAYSDVTLTTVTTLGETRIFDGGVALATQTPLITTISPSSIITVAGESFAPAGTSVLSPELDGEGRVSTNLANTCLEIDGERSRMFAALNNQINAQASNLLTPGVADAVVIRGCDTPDETRSDPMQVVVADLSPGLFNFVNNADGVNPLAALHGGGPGLVGEPGLIPGAEFTEAEPDEFVSFFGTGFGETDPPLAAGEIPIQVLPDSSGQAPLVNEVTFTIDGVPVPPEDMFYAGAAPCCAGLQQFVVKIHGDARDGNLPVRATVDGVSTPEGPYVTVKRR